MIKKRLFSLAFLQEFRKIVIQNTTFSYLFAVLAIPQAYLIADLIASHRNGSFQYKEYGIVFLSLLIFIRGFLHFYSEAGWTRFAHRIKEYLRNFLFEKSLQLNFHQSQKMDTFESHLVFTRAIEDLDDFFAGFLPKAVIAALFPFSVLIVTVYYDLFSFGVFFITMPIIPAFMFLIAKWVSSLTEKQWEKLFWLGNYLYDRISGLVSLHNYSASQRQSKILHKVTRDYKNATMDVLKIAFLSALTLELLATLSTAIIAVEIGLRLLFNNISFHMAMFILLLAPEFYLAFRNLGSQFHAAQNSSEAVNKIFSYLEKLEKGKKNLDLVRIKKEDLTFSLKIHKGFFQYSDNREQKEFSIFRNINLKIEDWPTESVLFIIGESGSGKSTLLSLLSGHLVWGKGYSIISPNKNWGKKDRINQNFLLPHSSQLFPVSIAQNIALGNSYSEKKLKDALKKTEMNKRIESIPGGIEILLNPEFNQFSSGEIRRLSLSRIFYHQNFKNYFLDEPYAYLDHSMLMRLHKRLKKQYLPHKRIIIATHRIDMIENNDYVIGIGDGNVQYHGLHERVIQSQKIYQKYYQYSLKIYGKI